jgi:hypothetical protein
MTDLRKKPARMLRLYLFGSTKGETVVLHMPDDRGWGVVDCYAPSLEDPRSNPAYALLERENIAELAFLCLTHPHDDHYRGMSQLLDRFVVQDFWTFSHFDRKKFNILHMYFRAEAARAKLQEYTENAEELERIFRLAREKKAEWRVSGTLKALYPLPGYEDAYFRIAGLTPPDSCSTRYLDSLIRRFSKDGYLLGPFPKGHHNSISIGLRIEFGRTRIILGGDVEWPAWASVLQDCTPEEIASHFIKVSHHGSRTGYCTGLWPAFALRGKPDVALTPYERHGLPDFDALEHIRAHVRTIHSTGPCYHRARPAPTDRAGDSGVKVGSIAKLRAARTESPDEARVGCCIVDLDNRGGCHVVHESPAGPV